MLHSLKERKRTMCSERKRMRCPTLLYTRHLVYKHDTSIVAVHTVGAVIFEKKKNWVLANAMLCQIVVGPSVIPKYNLLKMPNLEQNAFENFASNHKIMQTFLKNIYKGCS